MKVFEGVWAWTAFIAFLASILGLNRGPTCELQNLNFLFGHHFEPRESQYISYLGGSHRLEVTGGDSRSRGCGFESQYGVRDTGWIFFTIYCCKNCNVCLKKINEQRGREWSIFKIHCLSTSLSIVRLYLPHRAHFEVDGDRSKRYAIANICLL